MYSHPQHSVTLNSHVKLRKLNVTYVNTRDKYRLSFKFQFLQRVA